MVNHSLPPDAFGDRFAIEHLPLARKATGYAVQMLGTDKLIDRSTRDFLPIRSAALNGLFDSFDAAHTAARAWVDKHCPNPDDHHLAIVPATYDPVLQRHVLIYGVLCDHP